MNATASGVVLYDGLCNLCDGAVRFLVARDAHRVLRFASLDSDAARALLAERRYASNADEPGVLFVEGDRVFERSDAVLHIAALLGAPWSWVGAAGVIPRTVRERLYRLVAQNRYRVFGRRGACRVPSASERERFF